MTITIWSLDDDEAGREARRDAAATARDEWEAETALWDAHRWDEWEDEQADLIPADVRAWR